MRSLFLLLMFAAALGLTILSPYVGLLSWAWFSFMHPHRETYGFTATFSFDWYIAVLTLVMWAISAERKTFPLNSTTLLLLLFAAWVGVTTVLAIDPTQSFDAWERTEKSLLLALFVIIMTTTRARAHALVWVIAISIGYFSLLGIGWVLGGGGRAVGPIDSMIYDNNQFGAAVVTTIPLLVYLARTSAHKWIATGALGATVASILTVIGTFSRGALLALTGVGFFFLVRSGFRILPLALGLVAFVLVAQFAPQNWYDRMATIFTASEDLSVQERFSAWNVAWNVAKDRPITGGGFRFGEKQSVWDRYTVVRGSRFRAAHSTFFQLLGEHGFVGLILYLLLMLSAVQNTRVAIKIGRGVEGAESLVELSRALQLCILSIALGGIALSNAYYDLYLVIYALTLSVRRIVEDASRLQSHAAANGARETAPEAEGATVSARRFIR